MDAASWSVPNELPDLRRVGLVALDTETRDNALAVDRGSGWATRDGYLCGVSVAYRTGGELNAFYLPLRHPDSNNFDPDQVYHWLKDHVASDLRFVGQNSVYDWGWICSEANVYMPSSDRLEETNALATIIDENQRHYSLEALCKWRGLPGKDDALLREGCTALELHPNKRKKLRPQTHIWQLPARYVGPYAEADARSTLLLFENLDPILDQEHTRDAYRLEVDLLPLVLEMRKRGIRVDIPAAERARDLLLAKRDEVLAELSDKLGVQVSMYELARSAWLAKTFDCEGIKFPYTPKGNPSFQGGAKGWMLEHPHWLPQLISRAKKYHNAGANMVETYILGHVVNGRVHAEIHPHQAEDNGTRSFRFSYSNPPLQLMPSHDEELGTLIRGIFLPEDGETWCAPDCSQQEFRLLVHYAAVHGIPKAENAIARYRDDPDADFHAFVGALTGLPRTDAKAVNFAKIYGAGARKFAEMIKQPMVQAQALYARYDREMPFPRILSERYKSIAAHRGFITLFDGARRHFNLYAPGGKWTKGAGPCSREEAERRLADAGHPWFRHGPLYRADLHTALNALIQGSAARHTKLWMRACWREGIVPLLQMHDSLDCSVSSREQGELIAHLGCSVIKLKVPMRVDLKFGRTWADATHTWEELHNGTPIAAPTATPIIEIAAAAAAKPEPKRLCAHCDSELHDDQAREFDAGVWLHSECEDAYIEARMRQEGLWTATDGPVSQPPPQPARPPEPPPFFPPPARQQTRTNGSKDAAERDTYAEDHAGEPFDDAFLRRMGYRLAQGFDYTLADATLLYKQNRYEHRSKLAPGKNKPLKRFLAHRIVDGKDILGAGDRRVIYNWPTIMRAGPGSTVIVTEGENKAKTLIDKGLLATTVLSHKWTPECVAALTGYHLIILADHDKNGNQLANAARRQLATVAAGIRIVSAVHLWKHLPGEPEPRGGDDVVDWVRLGGDPKTLLDICRKIPAEGETLGEWDAGDDVDPPPPRGWLLDNIFCRRFVSSLYGDGGTGKTGLRYAQYLSLATGKLLTNEYVFQRCRVLIVSLEDDDRELRRRIRAARLHHKIELSEVKDWLFLSAPGTKVGKLVELDDKGRTCRSTLARILEQTIIQRRIDLIGLDPFVKTHAVSENDNKQIDAVVEVLAELATKYDIAVDIPHHTRKGPADPGNADRGRGASAQKDAGRLIYTLTTMSADEAKAFGLDEEERRFLIRMDSGKVNIGPPLWKAKWFRLVGVELDNATELYPNGDNVQTVEPWVPPDLWQDLDDDTIRRILGRIDAGLPDGTRYTDAPNAKARAAWKVIVAEAPDKTEKQAREIIKAWVKNGMLESYPYENEITRKPADGLRTIGKTGDPT